MDDVVDPRVRFYGRLRSSRILRLYAAEHGSINAGTPQTRVTEVWANVEGKGWKMANLQITQPLLARVAPAGEVTAGPVLAM